MTQGEFKAWFEGFCEGIDGRPTAKQWERVCERVKDIDGYAVTYPVYIERYVAPLRPWWDRPIYMTTYCGGVGIGSATVAGTAENGAMVQDGDGMAYMQAQANAAIAQSFGALPDWSAVGRAEFASLN